MMFSINGTASPILNTTRAARPKLVDFCEIPVDSSAESIAFAAFMISLLVASVIGNFLVITATFLSKQLRKRVTVYFIVSLAVSDMFNAVVLIPMHISVKLHYNRFCHSLGACYWMIIGDATTTLSSILNLFFIAMDRYIAISFPFKHQSMFSVSRVKKIIIGIWTCSVLYSFGGIFPWTRSPYLPPDATFSVTTKYDFCTNDNRTFYVSTFFGAYVIPLAIITFTYTVILRIALTQIRAIESTHIDIPTLNTSNNNNTVDLRKQRMKRIKRKELRATKSVALVYIFFLICWMPACIVVIILQFDETFFPELQKKNWSLFLFFWYGLIQILPSINTMINPLIYSFSNKQFRKGFRSVYKRLLVKVDSPHVSRSQRAASATSAISLASTAGNPNSSTSGRKYIVNQNKIGANIIDKRGSDISITNLKGGVENKGYHLESSLSDDSVL